MTPWNKKYNSREEILEIKRHKGRIYYAKNIKPVTHVTTKSRLLKRLALLLSRIKKCEICSKLYLPTRWYYKPCYNKSRFCTRACQHISQAQEFKDGRFNGENNPFYGKSHKKKSIKKMMQSLPNRKLESHWNWQGGISFKPYPLGWSKTYKEQIRYRDSYTCKICGVPESECSRKLHVHHIDYNKDNIKESNLISLCMSCHFKTNYNREYWIYFFTNKGEKNVIKKDVFCSKI